MIRVIRHYFPHIARTIDSKISDHRDMRGKSYTMHEAILSVVVMFLLKEGVLKDLNEEISLRPDKKTHQNRAGRLTWLNDLELKTHKLSWLTWEEACNCFAWITNMEIKDADMGIKLQRAARLRWKIENEGFNTQKNLGYNLERKYSRISFAATRNYYQCMQLAHLIEQLTLIRQIKELFSNGKTTIMKMSERLRNILVIGLINEKTIDKLLEKPSQIRFG